MIPCLVSARLVTALSGFEQNVKDFRLGNWYAGFAVIYTCYVGHRASRNDGGGQQIFPLLRWLFSLKR